jgi:hypothetical protein
MTLMIKNILHQIRIISIVVMTFAIVFILSSNAYAEYDCGTYGADEFGNDCPVEPTAQTPTQTQTNPSSNSYTTTPGVTPTNTNDTTVQQEPTPMTTTKKIVTKDDTPTKPMQYSQTIIAWLLIGLGVALIVGLIIYFVRR